MKHHMIEAVKRKRAMLKDQDSESFSDEDGELAPEGGSEPSPHEGMGSEEHEPISSEGERGGFHESDASAPENSEDEFQDPKMDTHDDADINMHRNMAGEGGGLATKYDKMGVDEHKDVRAQSSHMAKANMQKGSAGKVREHAMVAAKMKTQAPPASHGEDVHDSVAGSDEQQQLGSPMKRARSKLEGFLGKIKRS